MSRDWAKENPQNFVEYQEAMKFHKARAERAEAERDELRQAFRSLSAYYGRLLAYAPKQLQDQFKDNLRIAEQMKSQTGGEG